jgi:hypothetical protein
MTCRFSATGGRGELGSGLAKGLDIRASLSVR